jgi:hypothetical protein
MTKEEIAEIRGRDKEQARLAKIGQAIEQGFRELRMAIPCRGVYRSNPCKTVENDKSTCVLKYYCELKVLENA